jgi:hypothetical protein
MLGRDLHAAVSIAWDLSISRQHARIFRQAGLFWLEDLGSRSGTVLVPPGGPPQKLERRKPVLLLDQTQLELGTHARYRVEGLTHSSDTAIRLLHFQLVEAVNGLNHLPSEAQARQREQLKQFELRLRAAEDEAELLRLAADGIPTLWDTTVSGAVPAPPEPHGSKALPPLPADLPDPDDPDRVPSLFNLFVADIHAQLPHSGDDDDAPHHPA